MTRIVVVDASVVAKWLAPEPDSGAAEAWLDADLAAPDLPYPEVANILWKKTTRGEMTPQTADLAVRWLLQVPLRIHDGAGLLVEAVKLSQQLRHPAYDCFYLTLALRLDGLLVTPDRRLYDRCRRGDDAALALQGRVERLAVA